MKLLRRVFGRPTRDEFANLMLRALRRGGADEPLGYDSSHFVITIGEAGGRLSLANAYAEYCTVSWQQRPALLKRYANVCTQASIPDVFDEARPHLLPAIRNRASVEALRVHFQIDGVDSADTLFQPIADTLSAILVYDQPESMARLSATHLDQWGVAEDEAFEIARENLWAISRKEKFLNPSPGFYISPWQDNHDASRLYLYDLIWQLDVSGDHVALAPDRDTLFVTGSDDAEGLALMATLAQTVVQRPNRPISAIPVQLRRGLWTPFEADLSTPQLAPLKRLIVEARSTDYAEQKAALEALFESRDEDVFVASFSAVEKDTGEVGSYCVWSDGVASLLPRADEVAFFRDGEPKGDIVAIVGWDDAVAIAGDLMVKVDAVPERYRVDRFPDEPMLAELKAISRAKRDS